MFNVIAGHDRRDASTDERALDDYRDDGDDAVEGPRIGVIPGYFDAHLQAPVQAAVSDALGVLVTMGARIVDIAIAISMPTSPRS